MDQSNNTVLALYPNTYGVGYSMFDSPKDLVDFGIGYVQPVCSSKSFKRVKKYIEFYKPDVVLIRAIPEIKTRCGRRTQKLIQKICEEARHQDLEVFTYTRNQIKETFSEFDNNSKYQISKKIMEWFPLTEKLKLPKRKRWMSENHNAGVFDSISLALTHFYLK